MSTPSHTPPPVPRSGTPGTPGTPVRSGSAADLRRKSIDQVLTGVLDPKQKDQLFSPKTLNKKQRALSKSHSLGLAHVVGNYRIGATIGKGRYSVVKLANHVLTNEFVAIKIVSKSRLSKEDVRVLERCVRVCVCTHVGVVLHRCSLLSRLSKEDVRVLERCVCMCASTHVTVGLYRCPDLSPSPPGCRYYCVSVRGAFRSVFPSQARARVVRSVPGV